MHAHRHTSLKTLLFLIFATFAVILTEGQSVSISKQSTNFILLASPPPGAPHTLQATENFHLWIDVTNDLTDPFALLLEYPRVSSRFFRLTPSAPEAPPIRIMASGDSLIADCCGWGAGFYNYLKPNATFINYASPGRGSASALTNSADPTLQAMLLIKPDYVFFEYGVLDQGSGVSPEQFEANLRTLINIVRGFNGVPVFFTVQSYRQWDSAGNPDPWDHPFNPITRRVAAEMKTPLIDLHQITTDLYKKLGPTGSEFMIWTGIPNDIIHFSPVGAVWVSQLIAKTLPDSFGPYLSENLFDPPPNP
jgi:lysophospholipase L1-like esterase